MKDHQQHTVDRLAGVNGVVTGLALYPQLIKAFLTGGIGDLSSWAFALIFTNSVIWVVYAVHRNIKPLAIASFLNAIASGLIIILIFKTT